MVSMMQCYLAQIQEQLPMGGSRRARILSEIETHLLESWENEQERGVSSEEALAFVLERFGSPSLIVEQFVQLERERQLWLGKQYWQRACWFLAPLLFCYMIAALGLLGYDAPRLAFMHFTVDIKNGLDAMHASFMGVLLFCWLTLGGPLACTISGTMGIVVVKSRSSWIALLNFLFAVLGLAFLLFQLYSLMTD